MKSMNIALSLVLLASSVAHAADPTTEEQKPAPSATTSADNAAASAEPAVRTSTAARNDRLDLDTTIVTGNRELPKVLYIVPWKKADIGELPAQPFNSLLDEVLTPVDRDVFRREVTYYEAVSANGADANAPATAPAARPEK